MPEPWCALTAAMMQGGGKAVRAFFNTTAARTPTGCRPAIDKAVEDAIARSCTFAARRSAAETAFRQVAASADVFAARAIFG